MLTSGSSLASRLAWTGLGLAVVLAGCVRDPLSAECPALAPGELVISEFFKGDGTNHAWIELHNPTDRAHTLGGLRVATVPLTGDISKTWAFTVRDGELGVEPGGYVVLGQGDPRFWDYVDYDYTDDQSDDLEVEAELSIHACAERIDTVVYRGRPGVAGDDDSGTGGTGDTGDTGAAPDAPPITGPASFALDGAAPPSADDNDDTEERWCLDPTIHQTDPKKKPTFGTPGEANPPCPA